MMVVTTNLALALDVVEQRYIDQMVQGGNVSLKSAAQSIYNTGENNTDVLDVAAEILLQRYRTAQNHDMDTLAWVAKAIGQSGNGRYFSALKEVVDSDANRKITKHANKALKNIKGASGEQYRKGMVDIEALRSGKASTAKKAKPAAKPAAKPKRSGEASIDMIVAGMSMQEVYDLLGHPTATTSHQTGKAWIPFNFGGKDLARSIALYKGQGRVIFSHDAYSGTPKVIEVVVDPNESGYP
jgi:hypothetical protein